MIVFISEARRPTVCVCNFIVERLAGGIIGVKHCVPAFFIQFLENYYYSATCCCLVDGVLVVRDRTELSILQ